MLKPSHYISATGGFFLDIREVAVALPTEDGKLLVHLKHSSTPIVINCEPTQTQAMIASIIGWNHHCDGG